MSEHLNVGDVTGPRWAGGTRNPESTPAEELLYATPESINWESSWARMKAERDALREQLAAAEAARADAWDEGARYVTADSTYTEMFDIPKNPYRRTGDTNA